MAWRTGVRTTARRKRNPRRAAGRLQIEVSSIQFLLERFQDRDEAPDDDLVEALLGVVERTRSRSIAFGALNFLVETGTIGEFQPVDRMDAWKERNLPRG